MTSDVPDLPAALARLAGLPPAAAADAARADQDCRWAAGQRVPAEDYLAALPAVAADPEHALVLIYGEVLARTAAGDTPALPEYQHRFPHLAPRLADQFAVHDALLDGPADTVPMPPASGTDTRTADPPSSLGHYRVVRPLGRGGMGAVYLAEDTRLERPVALKLMLPEVARSPAARRRFLREARAVARVRHDHVVTIYQVDEADGVPFLAMELLAGDPLDRWLLAHPRPPVREACRIAREAAEGLAAAHAEGLVHRDVKPANLWVEAPSGRVKLLDFGLARAAAGTDLSAEGAVVGTPSYMAPEQARGERVDARADLFGLGCVLYRLLAGRPPFAGRGVTAVLTSLAVDDPTPAAALNAAVPPRLGALVDQLLAKDADARPASAAVVAAELGWIEAELAAPADDTVPVEPARPPRPRRMWPAAALPVGGVATLAVAAYLGSKPDAPDRSPPPANHPNPLPGVPADRRREELAAALALANPGFAGPVTCDEDEAGGVRVRFPADAVTDLSPLAAVDRLTDLHCSGSDPANPAPLASLEPLRGKRLRRLVVQATSVTDLSPLSGHPLTHMDLQSTRVRDLAPLAGLPLVDLNLSNTPATDFAPLAGRPIAHMYGPFDPVRDAAMIRSLTKLKRVNDMTPAEFLAGGK